MRQRVPAQHLVGVVVPVLRATRVEVEQDRRRHDRHGMRADAVSAPHPPQRICHAGGSIQTKGRTTGQDQRIDLLHCLVGGQKIGLPCTGRTAHHMHACGEWPVCHKHGGPCLDPQVGCVPNPEARDIGDQVHGASAGDQGHGFFPVSACRKRQNRVYHRRITKSLRVVSTTSHVPRNPGRNTKLSPARRVTGAPPSSVRMLRPDRIRQYSHSS